MPTTKNLFIPFQLLSRSHPEHAEQCPAYTNNGNGNRCTRKLKEDNIPEIEELVGSLQNSHETTIDNEKDETRESMLTKLAALTICGNQRNYRTAAVQQWKSELQPQDSAAASQETPPRNDNAPSFDDRGISKLEFTPYQTSLDRSVVEKLSCILGLENREMNHSRSQGPPARNRSDGRGYLYVFECEDAEGVCKFGRTKDLPRRTRDQNKCYPNLTEKWVHYCPDSEVFERVVQLELTQHRRNHECPSCNRTHTEWFKTDRDGLIQRVRVWCLFSMGLQSSEKRSQVDVPPPGFSSDPDRWYKWAQEYVQEWDMEVSHSEPNTSSKSVVDNAIVIGEGLSHLNLDDDVESVPELSPSSSALGSSDDDNIDPPTPTPIERSRNGKPTLGQRLIIPTTSAAASPVASPNAYSTPVERMPPYKGHVLFPRVPPGPFPVSPAKVVPNETKEDENELADILRNITLF